jgi:hypothetical protein
MWNQISWQPLAQLFGTPFWQPSACRLPAAKPLSRSRRSLAYTPAGIKKLSRSLNDTGSTMATAPAP